MQIAGRGSIGNLSKLEQQTELSTCFRGGVS
jgi:hypothetical protein